MALTEDSSKKVFDMFQDMFPGKHIETSHPHGGGYENIWVFPGTSIGNSEIKRLLDLSKEIGNSMCIGQKDVQVDLDNTLDSQYYICYF